MQYYEKGQFLAVKFVLQVGHIIYHIFQGLLPKAGAK